MSVADPRPVFFDLTSAVDPQALAALDGYLLEENICDFLAKHADGRLCVFPAEGKKHADCIELCDRDTSTWCQDEFQSLSSKDDFRVCRGHRGDPRTWKKNANAFLLPGVIDFVKSLPFFSQTGKIAIIINRANDTGVQHADIGQDDLVSEFVWVRTASSRKRFYVVDPVTKERVFAQAPGESAACVGWFDDHLQHNIEPVDHPQQWSLRIDGRFTPEYRALLSSQGVFGTQTNATSEDGGKGLAGVLASQVNGPCFLLHPNDAAYSDEENL